MTQSSDPLRLVESDDAPEALRQLLTQAAEHRVSSIHAAQLLRFVENQAASPSPVAESAPEAAARSAPHGGHAILSHLPGKFLASLAIVAMGVLSGALILERGSKHQISEQARPLPHFSASPSAVPLSVSVGDPTPRALPTAAAAELATQTSSALPQSREQTRSQQDKDEYALLRAARGALAREPARALSLADQHARQFASGMLAQEREAIAVDALVRLGQIGSARVRAQRFLRNYPQSPYVKRIENAVK